ncbi:IPT/TIG domain-containing protein [Flavisolibacter sp. BT320]|nr:IPT/TIG domain-containing protein [Flavisolibacter longurius]
MEKVKTLLFVRSENQTLFDGSTRGTTIKTVGDVRPTRLENEFQFVKGGLHIGRIPELEKARSFTLEALITPDTITGSRQNIMEAQKPAVAFFIDDGGFLQGTIHLQGGWQGVKSRIPLQPGRAQKVHFSRDTAGNLNLEINDQNVGMAMLPGDIVPVGEEGFRIGTWVDGSRYQFTGKIGNVQVRSGGLTTALKNEKWQKAKLLESALKTKIGLKTPITVFPALDESNQRLQKVKEIMQAAGVEKISDLATLQIKVPTTIPKGKVLIAPKKGGGVINWKDIVDRYRTATPELKKKQLATFLTNRNSTNVLNNAADEKNTLPSPGRNTPVDRPVIGRNTGLKALGKTGFPFDRVRIDDIIRVDKPDLTVRNKALLLKNLASKLPAAWPEISFIPTPFTSNQIPVNTSVIIAGILDLTNTELIIEPDVERLYVIAEQVICGPNAKITWRRPGGTTPARMENPSLNGRTWNGVHTKPGSRDGQDGGNGQPGEGGINGSDGRKAPSIEMWVKNLSNLPGIDLNGEDGIIGGKGQNGGRGGNGADGKNGERYWLFGWHCSTDPGDGGNGGNGGRGGDGGRGGNGGSGGQIVIGVLDGTLAGTVSAGQFQWKNQGGQKGRGGPGGNGGLGGFGGRSGNGETCQSARNGHNGAQAQPGTVGTDGSRLGIDGADLFFQFSEEDWNELLTRPFITEIAPAEVFPGNDITIKGSKFTTTDTVMVGSIALSPRVNPDESISVTIPATTGGGPRSVSVRRASDGTESNPISIRIKPQIDVMDRTLFAPGVEVRITGKAFLSGASVLIDGDAVPATVFGPTELRFTMPGTGGTGSAGRSVTVKVRNPDGLVSNSRTASMPRILEIPFQYGVHNLTIGNPTDGIPSWDTYEATFGAAEVWHELLDPVFGHPVLTGAYYGFYHYFLLGKDNGGLATGFCTSLASLVADKLWKGETDATSITKASIHKWITGVHGKLLSRESLLHFHDQSRREVANVETTARFIERAFLTGCDRNTAPLLFFIPSGAVWDAGYIDGLGSSHCIFPYRFAYPENHTGPQLSADGNTTINDLEGVELYCWDCNNDTNPNCRLHFRKENGVLHYSYLVNNTTVFDSKDNITLGYWTNGAYLLADHDLPFSGPFGLTSFILDFLLSPADIEITDEEGKRTGNFSSKIYSEITDSHPCYLMKGAYLLPVGKSLTRKIVGNGNGKYTFNSIMPDGTTIKIENIDTAPGQTDVLMVNADASQLRFAPHVEKNFTVTFSKLVGGELRSLALNGVGGGPATEIDITVAPDLSLFRLGNRSTVKNVNVQAFSIDKTTSTPVNKNASVVLPANHDLVVSVSNWKTIDLVAEALAF